MANAINPSFPGASFSYATPPVGPRAEVLTRTSALYEWAVPAGVTYMKVTGIGGSSDGTTAGGSSSIATIATFAGASTTANGAFSVGTTRNLQFIGVNYSLPTTFFTAYGQGSFNGGCGVVYLQNLVPGMLLRITIGSAGGAGSSGLIIIEY